MTKFFTILFFIALGIFLLLLGLFYLARRQAIGKGKPPGEKEQQERE